MKANDEIQSGCFESVDICPLCDSEDSETLFANFDRLYYLPGEFTTLRCADCGLIRISPRPTRLEMSNYYPETYSAYRNPATIHTLAKYDAPGIKSFIRQSILGELGYFESRRTLVNQLVGKILKPWFFERATFGYEHRFPQWTENGHALEIGCGNGFFLTFLKELGWEVQGVDLSDHAAAAARALGIDVFVGDILEAPLAAASFDFVRMSHVLEHTFDPLATMKRVRQFIKPTSQVYVEVPNAAGAGAIISGKYWFGWDAPRHLYMFTLETLSRLLVEAGFRIDRIETKPWDSFEWALNWESEEHSGSRIKDRPRIGKDQESRVRTLRREADNLYRQDPTKGDLIRCWASDSGD